MSNVNIFTQAQNLINFYKPTLKPDVVVAVESIDRYGSEHFEIRENGRLIWRAWVYEKSFLFDLETNLKQQQIAELTCIPLTTDQAMDLYNYVVSNGKGTGSCAAPEVPKNAEEMNILTDGMDVYTVWIIDGWPTIASEELSMCSWSI